MNRIIVVREMGLKEVKKYIAKLGKAKTLALSALKAEMGSLVAAEDQSELEDKMRGIGQRRKK